MAIGRPGLSVGVRVGTSSRVAAQPLVRRRLSLSVPLQVAVVYVPAMNSPFHTVPLAPASLLPIVALASVVPWGEELRKLLVRSLRRRRA